MRYLVLASILLFVSCGSPGLLYEFSTVDYNSTDLKYLLGAKSTIQESNIELIIHDKSKATYRKRVAITILDEDHANKAIVGVPYDQLSKVEYMNARMINRNGEVVRTFSMGDALDFSQFDGVSFFSDNRVKIFEIYSSSYPFTIEYEFEKTLFGTLNLPGWYPIDPDQSVVQSSFTIIDNGTGVRTHTVNFDAEPYTSLVDEGNLYRWTFNDKIAIETEPYSPVRDNTPYMLVSPGNFEIGGSSGDASTWKTFGKWYYDLGAETRELPNEAKQEIRELVSGVTDQEEIVAILFNYLQEKNRYVSIQLGIGGWKPFPAEYVFENSYGDCKALTNYMQAALEYVGINADAVLINATSSRPLIEEFSGNQFNHVVLRVVLENGKEIWLECTSKYLPPNNLGNGYSKKALLVTKNGGEIVQTPHKTYLDNVQISVYTLIISDDGKAELDGSLKYQGAGQSSVLYNVLSVSEAEKIEWLENQLQGDSKKIRYADFEEVSSQKETATISFKADLDNYANTSSKRLFIPVNKLNRWGFSFEEDDDRKLPVRFNYPFVESDSVMINIPEGFEIESYPKTIDLEENFATYSSELKQIDESTFLFHRNFNLKEREIEASSYNDLRSFLNQVRKADLQQLVLVRSES